MRSIQTKIILLILLGIVVASLVIGGAGIINSQIAIDNDSVQIMNLLCGEKAQELNSTLGRIEQSVEILGEYSVANIESYDRLVNDTAYRSEYNTFIANFGMTAVEKTDGAIAVYLRFSPDKFSSLEGFFQVKNMDTGEFEAYELTDFSKYEPDDVEHLGWYYIPVNAGKAVWLAPYYNKNVDIYMISYVEPIYYQNEIIGVVGMDIDFEYISAFIDSITVYDTGYAFLTDSELNIVYHKDGTELSVRDLSEELEGEDEVDITGADKLYDYNWNGKEKSLSLRPLNNGMCLAVTAPVHEIDSGKRWLINQIIFFVFGISVVFILVSAAIARSLVKPLRELNEAAKEIAGGNLDVKLTAKSKDEIGTLTESFRETADKLKEQMDYINSLAYTDSLTGVNNNTAYRRDVANLRGNISDGSACFAVAVIDVNGLKQINDSYGHEYGNILISDTAATAANVFGKENVYRIGGDEFAVLMRNATAEKCRELAEQFREELRTGGGAVLAAAAIGVSGFRTSDGSSEEVFRRADEEMYRIKSEMKKNNECSRVVSEEVPL